MSEDKQNTEAGANDSAPSWERSVLEKLASSALTEQKRARYWSIFFRMAFLVYLITVTAISLSTWAEKIKPGDGGTHTAVVDVVGMIADGTDTNAGSIIQGLKAAVEDDDTRGIILRLNTPGGSPVQSAYVYDEIRRLKKDHPNLPIHAVVSDICASGGYYIASAADKIFVNSASIIGSIGVIMNGFGFVDTLSKLGVERRLLTAGEHKAVLDPFLPVDSIEKTHIQGLLNRIHEQFIAAVKQGRGERLKDDPLLFSGLVWTGDDGVKLGLADGFGNTASVARDVIGAEKLVNFTPEEDFVQKLSQRLGTSFGAAVVAAMQGVGLNLR